MERGLYLVGVVFAGLLLINGGHAASETRVPLSTAHAAISDTLPKDAGTSSAEFAVTAQARLPAGQAKERTAPGRPAGAAAGRPRRPPVVPEWDTLPGEFAMRTLKGYYVTAINGGGRTTDPVIVTAATLAGPWEKFRLAVMNPSPPHDKSIQTSNGNYLTAVDGGGRTVDVLHTDATQVRGWERFRFIDQGNCKYAIQTVSGFYVGIFTDSYGYTLLTTRRSIISENEKFQLVMHGLASPVVVH